MRFFPGVLASVLVLGVLAQAAPAQVPTQAAGSTIQFDILIGIIVTGIAVATFVWRIVNQRTKAIEGRITTVDQKIDQKADKLEGKIDKLGEAVFELRGEVKGRGYAEMEATIRAMMEGRTDV